MSSMIDGLVFPDTRGVLFDLIDGSSHLGTPVRAVYHLPADSYGSIEGPFPLAHIYTIPGGGVGYVDRVDRIKVELYAPGEQAVDTLESIRASIVGWGIETPSVYVDKIEDISPPIDVPYQSDILNKAEAMFDVTTRPV